MKRSTAIVGLFAALLGIAGFFWQSARQSDVGERGGRRGNDIPAVLVTSPRIADVPIFIDAVGTVVALKTVTVRPQVDGRLTEVTFVEGQDVKAGDSLARIDPTIYQAQLDQAKAKKEQDAAQIANAKLDLARYEKLASDRSTSRQQADTQRALVEQLEAQVQSDQAAIDNAQAVLSYTTITSPLDGRTGIRLVDAGNIVHASDATGLVVITQIDPIAVTFSVPQQQLPAVRAAMAKGSPRVDILRPNEQQAVDAGTLNVIDNQIDQTTGTVRLKASFDNQARRLWPGQYVSVRVLVDTLEKVLVLPSETIQHGPNGPFVFLVKGDSTVAIQPVKLLRETSDVAVVDGVGGEERVIITGFSRLVNGTKVRVVESNAPPAAAGETPNADQATHRGRRSRQQ